MEAIRRELGEVFRACETCQSMSRWFFRSAGIAISLYFASMSRNSTHSGCIHNSLVIQGRPIDAMTIQASLNQVVDDDFVGHRESSLLDNLVSMLFIKLCFDADTYVHDCKAHSDILFPIRAIT